MFGARWLRKISKRQGKSTRTQRTWRPCVEQLETRCLLAMMPLTVEITRFETLPGNNPDTGGGGNFFAWITIAGDRHTTNIFDDGDGDFVGRVDWTHTKQVSTSGGPVQVVVHVLDHDAHGDDPHDEGGPDDEMDTNPLPGRRGQLFLSVDPRTGIVTNEGGVAFPHPSFPGLQGIDPNDGFFSQGKDDDEQGIVYFNIRLGAPNADNDLDGLLDTWETFGIDMDNPFGPADLSQTPDLRLPGSNPDHKDVYVEVDAMQGLVPQTQAMTNVVNAFASVPNALVNNPDGQPGVSLRLEDGAGNGDGLDEVNIPRATWNTVDANNWPIGFDTIKQNANSTIPGGFGTVAERLADPTKTTILAAKRLAYRYSIFGDQYAQRNAATPPVVALTSSSGLAEPSNDFMVTLGGWTVDGGTLNQQAGTFMHELGHTLGLDHGGVDGVNWKPNYHSIMNYTWQLPTVAGPGATAQQTAFQNSWTLDYSRQAFNVLTESALNEANGIGGHSGHVVRVGPVRDAAGNPVAAGFVNESGPIAWDGTANTSPARDINFLGDSNADGTTNAADATPGESLQPFVDWSNLRYNFRGSPGFDDGVHPQSEANELTLQAFLVFSDQTAPVSSLTIGTPQYTVGAAQPFVTSATSLSLTATDEASGVHSVSYRYFPQGFTPPAFTRVLGSSAQFAMTGSDGIYHVETQATDNAGNVETADMRLVYLDNTAPISTIVQPAATEYAHSDFLTLNYAISDGEGSGVSSFTPTLNGALTLAGHGLASGQLIHLLTELPVGKHTFAIAASDNLQNSGTKTVTFEVIVTPESIKEDVHYFLSVDQIKNQGLANSLLAKLNSAANAIARDQCPTAINIYEAFIHHLSAQKGKGVHVTAAAIMIADAEYLIEHCDRFTPQVASSPAPSAAVFSAEYWKNHAGQWPVSSLTLGGYTYTQSELLDILKSNANPDSRISLAHALIAAKLNVVNGSNPVAIQAVVDHADSLLSGLGKISKGGGNNKVKPLSDLGELMVADAALLEDYNDGQL